MFVSIMTSLIVALKTRKVQETIKFDVIFARATRRDLGYVGVEMREISTKGNLLTLFA